ncbi:MAG TPA: zinc-binding protein [Planctomycetes bacterium]|nr:zinc-binding protein [Planctomycetota bacterium]
MADKCSCGEKTVLFYACSGGANVAEIADKAARRLMFEGKGAMFCLAGIAAGIQGMIRQAKDAGVNLVIDGCSMDCAKKIFDAAGIANYRYVRVTDLGIEKVKGVHCTDEQVERVVAKAYEALGTTT